MTKYEMQYCRRCGQPYHDHVKKKCLFDAGTFLPQARSYGLVTNPAYQRWYQMRYDRTTAISIWADQIVNEEIPVTRALSSYDVCPPSRAIEYECCWCGQHDYWPCPERQEWVVRVVRCTLCGGENELL